MTWLSPLILVLQVAILVCQLVLAGLQKRIGQRIEVELRLAVIEQRERARRLSVQGLAQ